MQPSKKEKVLTNPMYTELIKCVLVNEIENLHLQICNSLKWGSPKLTKTSFCISSINGKNNLYGYNFITKTRVKGHLATYKINYPGIIEFLFINYFNIRKSKFDSKFNLDYNDTPLTKLIQQYLKSIFENKTIPSLREIFDSFIDGVGYAENKRINELKPSLEKTPSLTYLIFMQYANQRFFKKQISNIERAIAINLIVPIIPNSN